jgi:hypothetical protein
MFLKIKKNIKIFFSLLGSQLNTQVAFIINKLTTPVSVRNSYQQTEGVFDVRNIWIKN